MAATAPSSRLHAKLRQATKQAHHLLDHHPVLIPLIRQDLTSDQYGLVLTALHGVYVKAEAWIQACLQEHPGLFDYRSRRKLPALESDLEDLGLIPSVCSVPLEAKATIGALIGVLYVIEGATQGGQFIARNLRQIPGAKLPIRFFTGYGELACQRWDEFLQFADVHCPLSEYETAASTAAAVFKMIGTHLDSTHESRRLEEIHLDGGLH